MEKQITLPTSGTTRRYDIDWLRILAVLLLIPFHSARVFDFIEPFYVKNGETSVALSAFIGFVDPWHMRLLFLLAGAATWFALDVRGGAGYVKERVKRLLIPLLFGVLVIVPPQAYFARLFREGYTGSFLEYLQYYFTPHQANTDYTGLVFTMAHLWFIMFLFVYALVALPLFLYLKHDRRVVSWLAGLCERRGGIFLAILPLWLFGSLAEVGGQELFRDLVLFILGFLLVADARFLDAINRHKRAALIAGLVTMPAYLAIAAMQIEFVDNSPEDILFYTLRTINTWLWLVAILGYGRRFLNFSNRVQRYLNEAVYPFYILHQTVIVILAYYIVQWDVNLWVKFPVLAVSAFAASLLLYDVAVKRTNVTRFLFGMKPLKRPAPVTALPLQPMPKRP
jgi:glucan biosynthesis protein C